MNALSVNERVLQCFWELASLEEPVRLRASQQLVADLLEDQRAHGPEQQNNSSGPASTSGQHQEQQLPKQKQLEHALRRCSPIMTYSLRRLARGLGSGRAASRQGFAAALASLLSALQAQQNKDGKGSSGAASEGNGVLGAEDALVLLEHCLEAQGSGKGDMRDALLGRVFGLGALVRAGLIRSAPTASAVATSLFAAASKRTFLREAAVCVVLEMLLGGPQQGSFAGVPPAANGGGGGGEKEKKGKKEKGGGGNTWLEEGALTQLLGSGPGGCEALRKVLECRPQDATPECLLLAICLWPYLPQDLLAASPLPKGVPPPPAGFLRHPESVPRAKVQPCAAGLFSKTYLQQVLPVLQATTSASPRLHTLWNHLLPFLLPGFKPNKVKGSPEAHEDSTAHSTPPDPSQVETFWNVVVEDGLFTSSHERKFLGFQLFQVILPRLPASSATSVFSRNFSHALVLNLRKPDNYLHAMAKRVMDRANTFLEKCPDSAAKLSVSAALQRLGGLNFEQQAKAKATAKLIQGMDEAGVHAYLEQYMRAFLNGSASIGGAASAQHTNSSSNGNSKQQGKRKRGAEGEDGEGDESESDASSSEDEDADEGTRECEKRRAYALDQLVAAMRFPTITDEDRLKVLRFLATHAFFTPSESALQQQQPAPDSSARKAKKHSSKAGSLPQELALAVEAQKARAPPLTAATKRHCAQRLVSLAASAPAAHHNKQQQQQQQQQQQGADANGGPPSTKKQKVGPNAASPGPSQPPLPSDPARLLGPTLGCVQELLDSPAAQLAVQSTEEADTTLTILQELTRALEPLASQPQQQQVQHPARVRALLHLVQLLQLHVLGDPANAPEPSLVFDLRRVVKEAAGVALPELEEEVVEEESEDNEEGGQGSEESSQEGEAAERESQGATGTKPAWSEVLLDVLLSLLSRPSAPLPSAPLRGACESVWRVTCDALTLTGMQDLLRVVTAGDEKAGAEEANDLFEDEEEEEEELDMGGSDAEEGSSDEEQMGDGQPSPAQANKEQKQQNKREGGAAARGKSGDEGGSESGSSDEEEDESEEEGASDSEEEESEGEQGGGKSGRKVEGEKAGVSGGSGGEKGKSSGGSKGGDGSEEEEEESEGADDEQMFRMDDKIAAYLRATMDKKQGAKETAAALVALKFRALALLETYARKAPNSNVLLVAYVPLLRALAQASRHPTGGGSSNAVLADRLRGVLLKAMCKARPSYNPATLPIDMDPATAPPPPTKPGKRPPSAAKAAAAAAAAAANGATLKGALKTALFIASRAHDKGVAHAGSSTYAVLLKAAHSSSSPAAIELSESSFAAALTDFLRKKKSKLQQASLQECLAKTPGLASAAQPLSVVTKEAGGAARNAYTQAKAMELLLAHMRALANTATASSSTQQPTSSPHKPSTQTPTQPSTASGALHAAAAALKPHMKALAAALAAAVTGCGMKAEHHAEALKAAVGVVECVKRLHPGAKQGEVLGPERLNTLAKAVVTVRDLGVPDRVGAQLSRLSQVLSITELLSKTQPDPALKAKISKARAQMAEAKQQQQQQQQQKGQKQQKKKEGSQQQNQQKGKNAKAGEQGGGAKEAKKQQKKEAEKEAKKEQKADKGKGGGKEKGKKQPRAEGGEQDKGGSAKKKAKKA